METVADAPAKTRRWARKQSETEASAVAVAIPVPAYNNNGGSHAPLGKGSGRPAAGSAAVAGPGIGRGVLNVSGAFAQGVRSAFLQRYTADLERLAARADLPKDARWFDSHCHLESILQRSWRGGGKPQVLENEPEVSLQELVSSWPPGVEGCISNFAFKRESKPGYPAEWVWIDRNLHHFGPESPISDRLWFTIGLHPHDANNWDDFAEKTIRRLGSHPKCVGIGECGLDFFKHDQQEAELQLRAFRAQAKIAVQMGKALVIHGRLTSPQNEELCFRELQNAVPVEQPIHIHCYSDSLQHALRLCARWPNLRIGFTGSITFRDRKEGSKAKGKGKASDAAQAKGEEHSRALIQGLPLDRLLIETDGPYMCPEPFRGQTAHPGHVHRVAERIAEWKGVTLGEVMEATWKSTITVYGLGRGR